MTEDCRSIGVVYDVVYDKAGVAPFALGYIEAFGEGHLSGASCSTSIIDIGHLLVKLFAIFGCAATGKSTRRRTR